MDIGKKCIIMGFLGAILAIISSIFVISMIFKGGPIEAPVEKRILEPFLPNVFGPTFRVIDNRTILPYNIMEFILNPGEGKKQYKVLLNVETNGTINVSVSSRNSTFNILQTFTTGNHTVELQVSSRGNYLLNVTDIKSNKISAKFKVIESWFYEKTEIVFEIDFIKTVGSIAGFIGGISLLILALLKLKKAATEIRPEKVRSTTAKDRYIEIEEEE
ncbi:MAG: hypothetical protein RMI79_05825 [Nitrososphaerota archaeon]|nr:hypothetical protein [Nitrososphaerota archaeon]